MSPDPRPPQAPRFGKGRAILFNLDLSQVHWYMRERGQETRLRDTLGLVLARAGARRAYRVCDEAGHPLPACPIRVMRSGPIDLVGVLRDWRVQDTNPRLGQLVLGQQRFVYNVRTGRLIGRRRSVPLRVRSGQAELLACLPYRVESVNLAVPPQVRAGDWVPVSVTLQADGAQPSGHVVRLDLANPLGAPQTHYTRWLRGGPALKTRIPLALDDPPGPWTVRAVDIATGTVGTARFRLVPPVRK